jgi:hypothetical protein
VTMRDYTDAETWTELESAVGVMAREAWERAACVRWAPARATREQIEPLAAEREGHAPVETLSRERPSDAAIARHVEYALDGAGDVIASRRFSSPGTVDRLTLRLPLDAVPSEAAHLTFLIGFGGLRLACISVPCAVDGRIERVDVYADPREGLGTAVERIRRDDRGDIVAIDVERRVLAEPDDYRVVVRRKHGVIGEVVVQRADRDVIVYQDAAGRTRSRTRKRATKLLVTGIAAWAARTRPEAPVSCLAIIHSFEPYDLPPGLAWGLEEEVRQRSRLGLDAYRAGDFELFDPVPNGLTTDDLEREWNVLRQFWTDDNDHDEPARLFREVARAVSAKIRPKRAANFVVYAVEADYTDLRESLADAGLERVQPSGGSGRF